MKPLGGVLFILWVAAMLAQILSGPQSAEARPACYRPPEGVTTINGTPQYACPRPTPLSPAWCPGP